MPERSWILKVALPPFLILAAVAIYLYSHWEQIPQQFPIHWSSSGVPNRWATRNWRGVFGTLMAGGIMMIFMLTLTIALRYGATPGRIRTFGVSTLIGSTYLVCTTFSIVALLPLITIPAWILPLAAGPIFIVVIFWCAIQLRRAGVQPPVSAPGDLFVPKKSGMGYTLNMANPWSWGLLAVFVLSIPAIILVLP